MAYGYDKSPGEYQVYKDSGRPVRIEMQGGTLLGVVSETGPGYLHLNPSIVREDLPMPDGNMRFHARIETEIPTKVEYASIQGIQAVKDGYLEDLVKSINEIDPTKVKKEDSEKDKKSKSP